MTSSSSFTITAAVLLSLVVLALCHNAAHAQLQVTNAGTSSASCSNVPKATKTWNGNCTKFGGVNGFFEEENCWTPHGVPSSDDTVLFPQNSFALSNHTFYMPLYGKNVIIAKNAKVLLGGGAMDVSDCIIVQGTLNVTRTISYYGLSDGSFMKNPHQPGGTDCHTTAGFAPRVCGTAMLVVEDSALVTVNRLYASLFVDTHVKKGGVLEVNDYAFLWGNNTNEGTIRNKGQFYMHGHLYNFANASITTSRFDYDSYSGGVTLIVYNEGDLEFKLSAGTNDAYNSGGNTIGVKMINYKTASFTMAPKSECASYACSTVAYANFSLFNFGTISWESSQFGAQFFGGGSGIANLGTFSTSGMTVNLVDYISDNGKLITKDGGSFQFGNQAGIDDKTARQCLDHRQKQSGGKLQFAPRPDKPRTIAVKERKVVMSNATGCSDHNACGDGFCCNTDTQACEVSRCNMYGGETACCASNVGCGVSSHGPYCGWGTFAWEVDFDCVESLTFVDRYEYEASRKLFANQKHFAMLPKFGRFRYSFRGNSEILGDGTGAVLFSEAMEIPLGSELTVKDGGVLKSIMDNSAMPLRNGGKLHVDKDGRYVAGIRSGYTGEVPIRVTNGGRFDVGRFTRVHLHESAKISVDAASSFVVDGTLTLPDRREDLRDVAQCGALRGGGSIVGAFGELPCGKQ